MKPSRAALSALVLLLGALLAGCGSSGSAHNDADVAFAQGMIPHHRQAVQMARLAETNDAGPGVRRLAARIEDAQGPEIRTMTGWLEDWGEPTSGSMDHGSMDHGSGGMGMDGMLSGREMADLRRATGEEFDRLFLRGMIAHHEGAVDMARTEQEDGESRDAIALAKRIEKTQTAEITRMRELLG